MNAISMNRRLVGKAAGAALFIVWSAASAGACKRDTSIADEKLRGLVVAPRPAAVPTIGAVAKDGTLLARLLENPMGNPAASLASDAAPSAAGTRWPAPQTITAELHTVVREGEAVVMQLDENTRVSIAPEGYAARYENSGDNGREVVFRDNTFYLRTRYQKWHQRLPNEPREPFTVLAGFDTATAAMWELLAPGATIVDGGTTTVDGRPAHKLTLKAAAAARTMPKELLPQHAWRETRTITEVAGELVFDTSTLALLSATVTGRLNFVRDGRTLRMDVALTRRSSPGGGRIDIPDRENVVATAQRRGEADERDFLLEGIAPPSRKSPKNAAPVVPGSTMPAPLPSPGTPPPVDNEKGRAAKGTRSDQAELPATRSTEDAANKATAGDAAESDKHANADAPAESKPNAKGTAKADEPAKPRAASDTNSDSKADGKSSVKPEKKANAKSSSESSGTKSDKTSDPKSEAKSTTKSTTKADSTAASPTKTPSTAPTSTSKTAGDGKPANTGTTTTKSQAPVTERKP